MTLFLLGGAHPEPVTTSVPGKPSVHIIDGLGACDEGSRAGLKKGDESSGTVPFSSLSRDENDSFSARRGLSLQCWQ